MDIINISELPSIRYPAGRISRPIIGGTGPISSIHFTMGYVMLDPDGGQIPWHNHDPEEAYYILSGEGELCINSEIEIIRPGQLAYIPPHSFHQLTNISSCPLIMLYCCGKGTVLHGMQELQGTLPKAGEDIPPVPNGGRKQRA